MTDVMVKKNFVEKIYPVALDEFRRSKIHPYISITQSAHESAWGLSGLTAKANNLFGFTGELWAQEGKPVIRLETKEFVKGEWVKVMRPFRAYDSWAGSIRDWGNLISTAPRYKIAYSFAQEGDVDKYADAVAFAGYATDPTYADKLVGLYQGITNLLPPREDVI